MERIGLIVQYNSKIKTFQKLINVKIVDSQISSAIYLYLPRLGYLDSPLCKRNLLLKQKLKVLNNRNLEVIKVLSNLITVKCLLSLVFIRQKQNQRVIVSIFLYIIPEIYADKKVIS